MQPSKKRSKTANQPRPTTSPQAQAVAPIQTQVQENDIDAKIQAQFAALQDQLSNLRVLDRKWSETVTYDLNSITKRLENLENAIARVEGDMIALHKKLEDYAEIKVWCRCLRSAALREVNGVCADGFRLAVREGA